MNLPEPFCLHRVENDRADSAAGDGGEQRHQAGLEVMRRMGEGPAGSLGNDDPERAARFMHRTMGALGSL